MKQTTANPKLRHILAGINSLYAGDHEMTPFYVHALIMFSFMKSAWRLVDGSSQLAVEIARRIAENGGEIFRNAEVDHLGADNKTISWARLKDGTKISGKYFISNLHPAVTIDLVTDSLTKKAHRQRLHSMKNTVGMFTLYAVLKKNTFPYLNFNHHHFSEVNAWTTDYKTEDWPTHFMFYTPAVSSSETWAESAIVITYMHFQEVEKWVNTSVENRGGDYLDFKSRKAEQLIGFVNQKLPGFKDAIETFYTSTPLTYRDYTATPEGSAYGILKNWQDPLSTFISPRSRIPNLFYTGQNLNMHGILGVSIGSLLTCSEMVGLDYLVNKLKTF
jgi:all-trans-retinol 13,14-reductase